MLENDHVFLISLFFGTDNIVVVSWAFLEKSGYQDEHESPLKSISVLIVRMWQINQFVFEVISRELERALQNLKFEYV